MMQISLRSLRSWCNSLFGVIFFPVCRKKFPVSIAGNSLKEAPFLKDFVQAVRDVSTEIPCIFPVIREFGGRTRSLQPASTATEFVYPLKIALHSAMLRRCGFC